MLKIKCVVCYIVCATAGMIFACQEPELKPTLERFVGQIEAKAYGRLRLSDTINSLSFYRNLILGASIAGGCLSYDKVVIPTSLGHAFSQVIYPCAGLCVAGLPAVTIKLLQDRDKDLYENHVVKEFQELSIDDQNEIIRYIDRVHMENPMQSLETVDAVTWLRTCQLKAHESIQMAKSY